MKALQSRLWLWVAALLVMLAFAANSLLTRLALLEPDNSPLGFGMLRLCSGALVLLLLCARRWQAAMHWRYALPGGWLFVYVLGFSLAYRQLDAGAGALLLFAAAQLVMLVAAFLHKQRAGWPGALLALLGLVLFVGPGHVAGTGVAVGWMLLSGLGWGLYSLAGRQAASMLLLTTGSFFWASLLALATAVLAQTPLPQAGSGLWYGLVSGGLTSALAYVAWHWLASRLGSLRAGTLQLSVPVLAAGMGWLVLSELPSLQGCLAAGVILLGVAWTLRARH